MNRVLSVLKEKCDWDKPLAPGRGRGVASRIYNISPVAQAVEVTVAENGDFTVDRVVCVVDCGFAVNPLGIEGPRYRADSPRTHSPPHRQRDQR